MNLLLLSSSKAGNESYLETAKQFVYPHLADVRKVLFIPYAGVTVSWDDYTKKVQDALTDLEIEGIHQYSDPVQAVYDAKAILVGGGNTFNLLHTLYANNLIEPIRKVLSKGVPYIGWSAGSNICGNSIRTTNDMPIIQPPSFAGLNVIPFQLNPHYTDYQPPGHNGETRAQRIAEFCALNPSMPVLGIREGSGLIRKENTLRLVGSLPAVMFRGESMMELPSTTRVE